MLTNLLFRDRWIHTGYKNSILLCNHPITATTVTIIVAPCNEPKVMIRRTETSDSKKKYIYIYIRVSTDYLPLELLLYFVLI